MTYKEVYDYIYNQVSEMDHFCIDNLDNLVEKVWDGLDENICDEDDVDAELEGVLEDLGYYTEEDED